MLYFSRWKVTTILLTIFVALVVLIPNYLTSDQIKTYWPSWLPGRQVVLGLDLQGGV